MREKWAEERGVIITGVEDLVLPLFIPPFSLFLKVNRSPFSLQLNMCVERTHAGEPVPLAAPKLAEARTMGRDEWVWSHVPGIRWEGAARAAVV